MSTKKRSIGQLRHTLTLEQPARVPNGAGGSTTTWTQVGALAKGSIELEDGTQDADNEAVVGGKVQGTRSGWIEIRYRADITTSMRFTLGTRRFYVLGIRTPEESRRGGRLRVRVEERVS